MTVDELPIYTRLALRAVLPYCPDVEDIETLWSSMTKGQRKLAYMEGAMEVPYGSLAAHFGTGISTQEILFLVRLGIKDVCSAITYANSAECPIRAWEVWMRHPRLQHLEPVERADKIYYLLSMHIEEIPENITKPRRILDALLRIDDARRKRDEELFTKEFGEDYETMEIPELKGLPVGYQQIRTYKDLLAKAEEYNNCAKSYGWDMLSGNVYVFEKTEDTILISMNEKGVIEDTEYPSAGLVPKPLRDKIIKDLGGLPWRV